MQLITNMLAGLGMAELALVDYFVMGEAIGIVATLFVSFYYSRKQMQKLSIDIQTKILNDMDERMHELTRNMQRLCNSIRYIIDICPNVPIYICFRDLPMSKLEKMIHAYVHTLKWLLGSFSGRL